MVRRESGMMIAFGLGTWWYDLAGKWFRDDRIMSGHCRGGERVRHGLAEQRTSESGYGSVRQRGQ